MKDPMISVIMPTYSGERYIEEAIRSILAQTYEDFEFIIIDDGSSDKTREIVDRYAAIDSRIVFMRNQVNLGLPRTMNIGIDRARGKYICRMDHDDVSSPDRLEKQLAFMEGNPDVVISGGTMEVCNQDMRYICKRIYNLTDTEIRRKLFRYSPFCHPSTIFRTEAVREIGGYDEAIFPAEDYNLYFLLGRMGKFANIPDVILRMRVNPIGISYSNIRRSELVTLYVRLKAAFEYGYAMTVADKVYFAAQLASMMVMPAKVKYWLFTWVRSVIK